MQALSKGVSGLICSQAWQKDPVSLDENSKWIPCSDESFLPWELPSEDDPVLRQAQTSVCYSLGESHLEERMEKGQRLLVH